MIILAFCVKTKSMNESLYVTHPKELVQSNGKNKNISKILITMCNSTGNRTSVSFPKCNLLSLCYIVLRFVLTKEDPEENTVCFEEREFKE